MNEEKKYVDCNLVKEKVNKHMNVDDARDTLDRVIGFVSNCDTKASVVLGVLGVILTIFITDSTISKLYSIIKVATNSGTVLSVVFLILLVIAVVVLMLGILSLASVLIAKIRLSKNDSKIYFADIALNNDKDTYKEKVLDQSESDVIDDLITQTYINATICNKKFKRYNFGLVLTLLGLGLFIILIIIGILVYRIGG